MVQAAEKTAPAGPGWYLPAPPPSPPPQQHPQEEDDHPHVDAAQEDFLFGKALCGLLDVKSPSPPPGEGPPPQLGGPAAPHEAGDGPRRQQPQQPQQPHAGGGDEFRRPAEGGGARWAPQQAGEEYGAGGGVVSTDDGYVRVNGNGTVRTPDNACWQWKQTPAQPQPQPTALPPPHQLPSLTIGELLGVAQQVGIPKEVSDAFTSKHEIIAELERRRLAGHGHQPHHHQQQHPHMQQHPQQAAAPLPAALLPEGCQQPVEQVQQFVVVEDGPDGQQQYFTTNAQPQNVVGGQELILQPAERQVVVDASQQAAQAQQVVILPQGVDPATFDPRLAPQQQQVVQHPVQMQTLPGQVAAGQQVAASQQQVVQMVTFLPQSQFVPVQSAGGPVAVQAAQPHDHQQQRGGGGYDEHAGKQQHHHHHQQQQQQQFQRGGYGPQRGPADHHHQHQQGARHHHHQHQQHQHHHHQQDGAMAPARRQPLHQHGAGGKPGRQGRQMSRTAIIELKYGRRHGFECSVDCEKGTHVIVRRHSGQDVGVVFLAPGGPGEQIHGIQPQGEVLRLATDDEVREWRGVLAAEDAQALAHVRERVARHHLPLQIHHAHFQFDRRLVTFHYTSPLNRPNFKRLLHDGFRRFRCRIWMNNCCPTRDCPGEPVEPGHNGFPDWIENLSLLSC